MTPQQAPRRMDNLGLAFQEMLTVGGSGLPSPQTIAPRPPKNKGVPASTQEKLGWTTKVIEPAA